MKITFLPHSLEQMTEREIPEGRARSTLEIPTPSTLEIRDAPWRSGPSRISPDYLRS